MSGYWCVVALAAIEGGVRVYSIRAERRNVTARLRAAADRAKAAADKAKGGAR